uniref:Odorant receptor n=1 Tax=Phlebotomus papatasi TaxID=29031 RepID=A0A8W9BFS9_PHLPP
MTNIEVVQRVNLKDIYRRLLRSIDKTVAFFDLKFLEKDISQKFSARRSLCFGTMGIYPFLVIWTMSQYTDDYVHMIYCLTTLGVFFSVITRLHSIAYNSYKSREIYKEMNKAFERMETIPHIRSIFEKYLLISEKVFIATKMILLPSGLLLPLSSVMLFLWNGEKVLPYEFYIPWINPKTTSGFLVKLETFAFQMLNTKIVLDVILCTDAYFFCQMILGIGHLEVLRKYLSDFDAIVREGEIQQDREAVKEIIKRIVVEQQSHYKIMRSFESFYSLQGLVIILAQTIVLIIVIFVIMSKFWLQGFGFVFVSLGNMFAVTLTGTLFTISCEKFEQAIYNCKWYCLPADFQFNFIVILRAAQYPVKPTMGGILPMELATFVVVFLHKKCLYRNYVAVQLFALTLMEK